MQEEEKLLQRFLSTEAPKSLGELIFEKIKEAEASKRAAAGDDAPVEAIPAKAVEVFSQVPLL